MAEAAVPDVLTFQLLDCWKGGDGGEGGQGFVDIHIIFGVAKT